MSLNGRMISIREIIWKIYQSSGIQDEINFADCVEWAVDCLEQIYHPEIFEKKVIGHISDSEYDVTNYRCRIPCDLRHLVAMTVDGYPALPSTNTFHQLREGACCGVDEFASELSEGVFVDGFGNTFASGLGTIYGGLPLTYELNNDWITLSVKTGKVCIAYLAFSVDCDGFPMIPDNVSFKEAISRAVIARLDYIRWRQNSSDNGLRLLHEHSEREYMWYIAQAMNAAKHMDIDKTENLKNMILRLKPRINQWANNFSTLNVQENRKLK